MISVWWPFFVSNYMAVITSCFYKSRPSHVSKHVAVMFQFALKREAKSRRVVSHFSALGLQTSTFSGQGRKISTSTTLRKILTWTTWSFWTWQKISTSKSCLQLLGEKSRLQQLWEFTWSFLRFWNIYRNLTYGYRITFWLKNFLLFV